MIGNFTFYNPTKLHFGKDSLELLGQELRLYGPKVMLTYGGGSIKRTGIYDKVIAILKAEGKTIVEDPGVMPNPTVEKLREGATVAREQNVDLILAVGGGSVVDYAKGVAASAWCEEDPWEKYYLRQENPSCRLIPVGTVLTMVGTGSEMNGGSVITNHAAKLKIGKVFGPENFPRFTVLNPEFTYSVPRYQMVAGIFDIMSHIMEQYFSGTDDNTSDYISEALMRSLIVSSVAAVEDPENYEARSNIMWTATWALNTLTKMGKGQDWQVHMIGQSIGAYTDATHGMTLAAVSPAYYRYIMPYGLQKFVRWARTVWDVRESGLSDEQTALRGIEAMENWMHRIGLVMNITELGVSDDMLEGIAAGAPSISTAYKPLTRAEIVEILRRSK